MSQQQPKHVKLKDEIDPQTLGDESFAFEDHPYRTPGKDEVAIAILKMQDHGEWPQTIEDIAERTGWSASHVRNTKRDYFEPADEPTHYIGRDKETAQGNDIEIPDDVENTDDFLRGVAIGYNLSRD